MKIHEERRIKLVNVLSDVLCRLCERNDRFIINHAPVTRFHTLRAPQITVKAYLNRIAKYSICSEECFILALIYIDRLIKYNGNFLVNSLNVHRLIITSIMLAAKFFDDQYFNNAYFGKVGGVSCKEINLLEIEFVFMINFNLYVESKMFEMYNKRLMGHAQPSENDGPQEESHNAKTYKPVSKPMSEAKGFNAPAKPTQSVGQPLVNSSQSKARPTPTDALNVNPQNVMPSKRRVSPSVVTRVRQRCTPPSPNFLQTSERIHMKTY